MFISVGELNGKGCTVIAKGQHFTVTKEEKHVFGGNIKNNLYLVSNTDKIGSRNSAIVTSPKESLQEIHEKFGHASISRISHLLDSSISQSERDSFECKPCIMAKITKQPFKIKSKTVNKPFDRIHLDLIGPIKPKSSLKHQFILMVVENHSGYLAGFPFVHKDNTTDILIQLLETEEQHWGYLPLMICSDGCGEFFGNR